MKDLKYVLSIFAVFAALIIYGACSTTKKTTTVTTPEPQAVVAEKPQPAKVIPADLGAPTAGRGR